jgi:uncharacterized protein (TIGR00725 family)
MGLVDSPPNRSEESVGAQATVFDPVSRKPIVAVIGASSAEERTRRVAEEVGRKIGLEGWHLLTGGGAGVMEAACRGYQQADASKRGRAIGILPAETADAVNPYVDIALPTGLGIARNALIARAADALIAVGGCSGTLSEMALAWQLGRPIAACADSGGWAEKMAGAAIDDRFHEPIFAARTADEAISFVKSHLVSRV